MVSGGVDLDPCLSNPCLNRGECIQLRFGRYKCECTGTNFTGEKCEKGNCHSCGMIMQSTTLHSPFTACPPRLGANAFKMEEGEANPDFPLDCLIIWLHFSIKFNDFKTTFSIWCVVVVCLTFIDKKSTIVSWLRKPLKKSTKQKNRQN